MGKEAGGDRMRHATPTSDVYSVIRSGRKTYKPELRETIERSADYREYCRQKNEAIRQDCMDIERWFDTAPEAEEWRRA